MEDYRIINKSLLKLTDVSENIQRTGIKKFVFLLQYIHFFQLAEAKNPKRGVQACFVNYVGFSFPLFFAKGFSGLQNFKSC